MYSFLFRRFGSRVAFWLTVLWYLALLVLVALSFAGPAAEFRYGQI